MPVSHAEQKVRKGDKTYVSPHTRRAQNYKHSSVILHSKLLFICCEHATTVCIPHLLNDYILTVWEPASR